jgi:hypothetical protein
MANATIVERLGYAASPPAIVAGVQSETELA